MLPEEPSDDVRFYVVWVNRGYGDNRGAVDTSLLQDSRVTQYWDPEPVTAQLTSRGLGGLGQQALLYDVYYVFGREATWRDLPGPVTAVGGTIVEETERLLAEIRAQL